MTDDWSPTTEERANFLLNHSADLIGYVDTLESVTDEDSANSAVNKLHREFSEGTRQVMRNKREHGFHPIKAWEFAVDDEWPEWVRILLAESEHQIFQGDPEFMTDEEDEYVEFLEDEYAVPR